MKILLLANYILDEDLVSMRSFAEMLYAGFRARGHDVRIARPGVLFGGVMRREGAVKKWLGYIDKYAVFPSRIAGEAAWADVVHITDHSNALYTPYLQKMPHVVTCHDVLAIRGGLGEDTDCPASASGKILQRWILKGLRNARMVACDSDYTRGDLLRILKKDDTGNIKVIRPGLLYPYKVLKREEAYERLSVIPAISPETSYILHVGANLRRKNREGVLRIFALVSKIRDFKLVMAGQALSGDLKDQARMLGLEDKIIEVPKPANPVLEALYNGAFALLYPSRFEGYGLPIIEAQACGCPVLCSSDCGPFPEIVLDSAMTYPSADEAGFAKGIMQLLDNGNRGTWVEKGLQNSARFNTEIMLSAYEDLYKNLRSE